MPSRPAPTSGVATSGPDARAGAGAAGPGRARRPPRASCASAGAAPTARRCCGPASSTPRRGRRAGAGARRGSGRASEGRREAARQDHIATGSSSNARASMAASAGTSASLAGRTLVVADDTGESSQLVGGGGDPGRLTPLGHTPTAMAPRFSIAHVTPYPWEAQHEINTFVREAAGELSARGHRVLILAPSRSSTAINDSRRALRDARREPERLLAGTDDGEPRVLAVGEVLDVPGAARRRPPALPIDVARTVEEVLRAGAARLRARARAVRAEHVELRAAPLALAERRQLPRAHRAPARHPAGAALRRAVPRAARRAHGQLRRHRRRSWRATSRPTIASCCPGPTPPAWPVRRRAPPGEPVELLFVEQEERAAQRLLLRALRRLQLHTAVAGDRAEHPRRVDVDPAAGASCATACAS